MKSVLPVIDGGELRRVSRTPDAYGLKCGTAVALRLIEHRDVRNVTRIRPRLTLTVREGMNASRSGL